MPGIYLHIPFCKQRCHYCDFHKSLALSQKPEMLKAMLRELEMRRNYTGEQEVETIYFGGGTPSVLSHKELDKLLSAVFKLFRVNLDVEITLEANPDDLTPVFLEGIRRTGFNRLSIGIQSFREKDLELMNRRHNQQQALQCVPFAREANFENFSIDLIYGIPGLDMKDWKQNILTALEMEPPHISAYHLTFEEGTPFYRWRKEGRLKEVDENLSLEQFRLLNQLLAEKGYLHYEISNYAQEGYESRHNAAYWEGKTYLGIGPSAHSYNGHERQWNIPDNLKYIKSVNEGCPEPEREILEEKTLYNELVMTGLRTSKGLDTRKIELKFGKKMAGYCRKASKPWIRSGKITEEDGIMRLTEDGMFVSDRIISDLFLA